MGRDSSSPPKPFGDGKTYWVKGSTLNAIWGAIRANRPIAGKGMTTSQTHDGTQIHRKTT